MKSFLLLILLIVNVQFSFAFGDIRIPIGKKICQKDGSLLNMKVSITSRIIKPWNQPDKTFVQYDLNSSEIGDCSKELCSYCGFFNMSVENNKIFANTKQPNSQKIEIGTIPENLEPYFVEYFPNIRMNQYDSIPVTLKENFIVKNAKFKKIYRINTNADRDENGTSIERLFTLELIKESTGEHFILP